MVVVEDLVRDAGAVDAADDLYVGAAVGFRKVAGESECRCRRVQEGSQEECFSC